MPEDPEEDKKNPGHRLGAGGQLAAGRIRDPEVVEDGRD